MKHFTAFIMRWYREAADRYAIFQWLLGIHYQHGIGMAKNEVKAVKWFRKAAEQGNDYGQVALGMCYDEGIGVEKDEVEAVKWFRKAAEQGDTSAQFFLGSCYNEGKGMEKDEIEAYAYFNLAAITAAYAREKRDAMESGMESTQRAEGQRRTKELQAQIEKSQGK